MPEIVKSVRIVAGGGRPLHSDPGSLSWSWPGQCPDLSRGELGFKLSYGSAE